MMIKEGCMAIVTKGHCIENIGKLVKVGKCVGSPPGLYDGIWWEVNIPMKTIHGNYIHMQREDHMQRIDDHPPVEIKERELAHNEKTI